MLWTPNSEADPAAGVRAWQPDHFSARALPASRYVLYFPLTLSAIAVLMWLMPSDGMLGFGCFVATGIGISLLWDFLFRDHLVRLTRVSAMGFLLGYSGGTLNTWLTLPRAGYSLASRAGLMRGELCHGVAATILGCACLLVVGELLEVPVLDITDRIAISPGLKRIALSGIVLVPPIFTAVRLKQGGMTSGTHGGVLAVLLDFLAIPTVILSTIIFLMEKKGSGRLLWGVAVVLLWLLQVNLGRRNLVYAAVITVALARHAGYQWNKLSFRQILVIGIGTTFLFLGFLTYELLRVASYAHKEASYAQQLATAGRWVEEGRAWKIAITSTQQNVEGRTFVVAWFSDLLELSSTMPTAHGRDLFIQTEDAIPKQFIPNKPVIQEEDIASEQFNRNYPDQANSLMTAGVIDFGLAGVMVYPLVVVFCMSYVVRTLKKLMDHEIYVYGFVISLMFSIATEVTLTGFEVAIRNIVIIAIGLYVLLRLPSFRIKAEPGRGGLS